MSDELWPAVTPIFQISDPQTSTKSLDVCVAFSDAATPDRGNKIFR
jgi:hypothetical protein